ncbi:MAG: hypothetical protein H6Q70_144 [Firmicutes bacterium]|nr:hypothetical protein [Bacillota bacterium]
MITLKNKNTGLVKECPTGYSWTTFFFGVFVPLLRGDLKWAAILFFISLLIGIPTLGFGSLLVGPVFAYFYNKIFIKAMIEKRYTYADEDTKSYLISNGIICSEPEIEIQGEKSKDLTIS